MTAEDNRVPRAIRRHDSALEIDWGAVTGVTLLPLRALRLACPCAACVDEVSGRQLLDPATVPPDIRIDALELVGAYGLRIRWSDGHGTGIYTFAALRAAG